MDKWSQDELREALDARGTPLENEAYCYLCEYLFPIAKSLMSGREDWAEEAVQRTIIRVHQYYPRFEWRSKFQTWACLILRNIVNDIYSGQPKEEPIEGDNGSVKELPTPDDAPDDDHGFADDFRNCMDKLPEKQRIAFLGITLGRSTVDDVAQLIGTTAGYAYRLSHEARKSLRECLESAGWGIKRFAKLGNVLWRRMIL